MVPKIFLLYFSCLTVINCCKSDKWNYLLIQSELVTIVTSGYQDKYFHYCLCLDGKFLLWKQSKHKTKQNKTVTIHELWKQTEPICSRVKCPQFYVILEERCIQHKLDEHLLYVHVALATDNVKAKSVFCSPQPQGTEEYFGKCDK